MIVQFLLLLLLLTFFILYKYLYKPKKKLLLYRKKFQQLGYKVAQLPFAFMGSAFDTIRKKGFKQKKDVLFYFKHNQQYLSCDVLLHNLLGDVILELVSPQIMKGFFKPQNAYQLHKIKNVFKPLINRFGAGIIFSQDDVWKQKRKAITSVFTFDFLKNRIPHFVKICNEQIQLIEKQSLQNKTLKNRKYEIYILDMTASIFSNILLQVFLGGSAKNQKLNGKLVSSFLGELLNNLLDQAFSLEVLAFGFWITNISWISKFKKVKNDSFLFRSWAQNFIKQRVENLKGKQLLQQPNDIIQALMKGNLIQLQPQKQQKQADKPYKMNFQKLVDQFCIFYLAATDTTFHMMVFLIYYIALNPKVQQKLRQQIKEHIKGNQNDFAYDNLKKMKYIDYIQNQTLRLSGVVSGLFWRYANKDCLIGNIPIQKGTLMSVSWTLNNYNPKYFKDPLQFRPQRWESECNNLDPFTSCSFSAGPRGCLGKHLALIETKVALIIFMNRYKKIILPVKQLQVNAKLLPQPVKFLTQVTLSDKIELKE